MKRKKLSRKASQKMFKKNTGVQAMNSRPPSSRGGYVL